MTDRAFLKTFSGLLAALVALTVIIFVVAQMVSGSSKAKTKVAKATQADDEILAWHFGQGMSAISESVNLIWPHCDTLIWPHLINV